jgi:hypothetical protein
MNEFKVVMNFAQLIFGFEDVASDKLDPEWEISPQQVCECLYKLLKIELHNILPNLLHPRRDDGSFLDLRKDYLFQQKLVDFDLQEINIKDNNGNKTNEMNSKDDSKEAIVVGISGKKKAGKSTVATYLKSEYGFKEISFAYLLKLACRYLFLLSEQQVEDQMEKEKIDQRWGVSPREILQVIGTDIMKIGLIKHVHIKVLKKEGIWAYVTKRKILELMRNGVNKICISDVRFPDEIECLRFFKNVKIFRLERKIDELKENSETMNHTSETALDSFPLPIIQNNGTICDLYKEIDRVVFE